MEQTLVESLPLADREQLERVRVVRDERHGRLNGRTVEGQNEALPLAEEDRQRGNVGEGVAPAPVVLAPVDEPGVEAERDVVQEEPVAGPPDVDPPLAAGERLERTDGVVAVEAEVAREVVPGAEGHAHERKV